MAGAKYGMGDGTIGAGATLPGEEDQGLVGAAGSQTGLGELFIALDRAVRLNDTELTDMVRERIAELLGGTVTPVSVIKPATTITQGIINPEAAHLDLIEDVAVDENGPDDNTGGGTERTKPSPDSESDPAQRKEETGKTVGEQKQDQTGSVSRHDRDDTTEAEAAGCPDHGLLLKSPGDGQKPSRDGRQERHRILEIQYNRRRSALVTKTLKERIEEQPDYSFADKLQELFDRIAGVVLERLPQSPAGVPDTTALAALAKAELLALLLGDLAEWRLQFQEVGTPIVLRSLGTGINTAVEELQDSGFAIELPLELTHELIVQEARSLTEDFASQVVDVVGEDVVRAVREGLAANENVYGIADRIAAQYGGGAGDPAAVRIARTETSRALNAGARIAWREAGIEENEWLASGACEFCTALNGLRVGLDIPFVGQGEVIRGTNGGSYSTSYGDVMHPPLHPHCTCTVLAVIPPDHQEH
jgi:hypothetical protein